MIMKITRSIYHLPDYTSQLEETMCIIRKEQIRLGPHPSSRDCIPFVRDDRIILPEGKYQSYRYFHKLFSKIIDMDTQGNLLIVIQLYNSKYGSYRKTYLFIHDEHEKYAYRVYQTSHNVYTIQEALTQKMKLIELTELKESD